MNVGDVNTNTEELSGCFDMDQWCSCADYRQALRFRWEKRGRAFPLAEVGSAHSYDDRDDSLLSMRP